MRNCSRALAGATLVQGACATPRMHVSGCSPSEQCEVTGGDLTPPTVTARPCRSSWNGSCRAGVGPLAPRLDGRPIPTTVAIVETFNNGEARWLPSISAFPTTSRPSLTSFFGHQNKSAVIAELMRNAVAEAKRRKQRESIFRTLTQRRAERPALTDKQLRASRRAGRP